MSATDNCPTCSIGLRHSGHEHYTQGDLDVYRATMSALRELKADKRAVVHLLTGFSYEDIDDLGGVR